MKEKMHQQLPESGRNVSHSKYCFSLYGQFGKDLRSAFNRSPTASRRTPVTAADLLADPATATRLLPCIEFRHALHEAWLDEASIVA
jgi:hypothetical protein